MSYFFWAIVAFLCAACIAWLLRAFGRANAGDYSAHDTELVRIYRDRLKQLETQYNNNEIDRPYYDAAREEQEAALAAELPEHSPAPPDEASARNNTVRAWAVAITLPAVAAGLYLLLGEPGALSPEGIQARGGEQMPSVETMVARLEARLESDPDDVQGWAMLGRSYTALGELDNARRAYAQAVERAPDDAELLLDYAEAIARTNNNSLAGEPRMLIDEALQINPQSLRGRVLRGVAAFHEGNRREAIDRWVALLNEPGTTEEQRQLLNQFIAAAGKQSAGETQASPAAAEGDAKITVRVALADRLRDRVDPADTLFVYARATSGPPMPLAIERHTAADLPLEVVLDDGDAMTQRMKLSAMDKVVVAARISKSGDAQPASGDLQTTSPTLDPSSSPEIELTIDQVVP